MLKEIEGDCDWEHVFSFASGIDVGNDSPASTPDAARPGSPVSTAAFTREDVTRILGIAEGEREDTRILSDGEVEPDDINWLIAVELSDGRFGMVEGGCDYTGWG